MHSRRPIQPNQPVSHSFNENNILLILILLVHLQRARGGNNISLHLYQPLTFYVSSGAAAAATVVVHWLWSRRHAVYVSLNIRLNDWLTDWSISSNPSIHSSSALDQGGSERAATAETNTCMFRATWSLCGAQTNRLRHCIGWIGTYIGEECPSAANAKANRDFLFYCCSSS